MEQFQLSFKDRGLEEQFLEHYYSNEFSMDLLFQYLIMLSACALRIVQAVMNSGLFSWPTAAILIYTLSWGGLIMGRRFLGEFEGPTAKPWLRMAWSAIGRMSGVLFLVFTLPIFALPAKKDTLFTILRYLVLDSGVAYQMVVHVAFPLPIKYEIFVAVTSGFVFHKTLRHFVCQMATATSSGLSIIQNINDLFSELSYYNGVFQFLEIYDGDCPNCNVLLDFINVCFSVIFPMWVVSLHERNMRKQFILSHGIEGNREDSASFVKTHSSILVELAVLYLLFVLTWTAMVGFHGPKA